MIIRAQNILSYLAIAIVACMPASVFAAWNAQQVQSPPIGLDISIFNVPILFLVIQYALAIFGFWSILKFIVSGILYFMSAGDEETTSQAKSSWINAGVSILAMLLGYILIAALGSYFGIDSSATRL